ncbi:MAG: ABC-type transport auxiliary lipoprotein family protein [Spirochaetales bacterium]|nr:ABC-type transport auxiliary lipoprotein family protein [Spirochaetales bacterium]
MRTRFLPIVILILVLSSAGCIGGKSVESSYLRLDGYRSIGECERVNPDMPRLALKRFSSLPALDRETVIVAKGQVMKPDYRWSWEGTPAEIFDLVAGPALNCMNSYEVISPYRPGIEKDLVLSGVITSFEIQRRGGDAFKVAVRYSLWDGSGKNLLARKLVEAEAPVKSMRGEAIAQAAQEAVDGLMKNTILWIDGLGGEMLSRTAGR